MNERSALRTKQLTEEAKLFRLQRQPLQKQAIFSLFSSLTTFQFIISLILNYFNKIRLSKSTVFSVISQFLIPHNNVYLTNGAFSHTTMYENAS